MLHGFWILSRLVKVMWHLECILHSFCLIYIEKFYIHGSNVSNVCFQSVLFLFCFFCSKLFVFLQLLPTSISESFWASKGLEICMVGNGHTLIFSLWAQREILSCASKISCTAEFEGKQTLFRSRTMWYWVEAALSWSSKSLCCRHGMCYMNGPDCSDITDCW